MIKYKSLVKVVIFASLSMGVWHFGNVIWIYSKAYVVTILIDDAWQVSLANDTINKPWSWADTWPVARLDSVELDASWIVLDGAHGESLAFGPGQVAGTGERKGVVIAGHRDTHFSQLAEVELGNVFRLQDRHGEWRHYRVGNMRVVDSRKEAINLNELPADRLLLVTCYPFNGLTSDGPLRYVIEADLQLVPIAAEHRLQSSIAGT